MSAETGRPTMHEVARVAGVSHATVSRVLNGHTNVAPATARAVADAIITTGYVPNRAARSLRVQSTDTVVLVAREKADVFYSEPTLSPMASGANLRLSEHGYQMLLALVDSSRSAERVGSLIAGGSFDAAILVAMSNDDPLIARLMATNTPLVTSSTPFPGFDIPSADTDNVGGSRAITARLVATGRSKLVAIGGPSWAPVTQLRLDGFHQGAKNAALGHTTVNEWTLAAGKRAMRNSLSFTRTSTVLSRPQICWRREQPEPSTRSVGGSHRTSASSGSTMHQSRLSTILRCRRCAAMPGQRELPWPTWLSRRFAARSSPNPTSYYPTK